MFSTLCYYSILIILKKTGLFKFFRSVDGTKGYVGGLGSPGDLPKATYLRTQ